MFSKTVRNAIDIFGHVAFLLPLTIVMIVTGWPFFLASFRLNEQSFNAGGLPQWPAKSLVVIGFTLLFFQGISELIKRIAILRGKIPDPHAGGGSSAEAEAAELIRLLQKK
jgi:TRAP-type mannitol/chloroaromatic compound transport system permease small subunit